MVNENITSFLTQPQVDGALKIIIKRAPAEEINKLVLYYRPGNVRELKHFIERAVILSNGYDISFAGLEFETAAQDSGGIGEIVSLADMERDHIEKALKSTLWKISGCFAYF